MSRVAFSEDGQATGFAVVILMSLLGMAALVVDAGSWFQADRSAQSSADAAALAAAQALPADPASAYTLAEEYAEQNGDWLQVGEVRIESGFGADDTVRVEITGNAPGFFARVLGFDGATVGAVAAARAALPSAVGHGAPIGVDEHHEYLSGSGCPCFGQSTDLDLEKVGPGAFKLINVDGSRGGTSPGTLGDWIREGYDGYMPLGWYYSDPGAKFNSSHVQDALTARLNTELLFPVYRSIRGNGANLEYEIVGWVGFHLTGFEARGNDGHLYGWFTRVVWDGIQGQTGATQPDFGVRTVSLVE
jgi:hypothetical protein